MVIILNKKNYKQLLAPLKSDNSELITPTYNVINLNINDPKRLLLTPTVWVDASDREKIERLARETNVRNIARCCYMLCNKKLQIGRMNEDKPEKYLPPKFCSVQLLFFVTGRHEIYYTKVSNCSCATMTDVASLLEEIPEFPDYISLEQHLGTIIGTSVVFSLALYCKSLREHYCSKKTLFVTESIILTENFFIALRFNL